MLTDYEISMKLPAIKITRKSGDEPFISDEKNLGIFISDFWQWSSSDITGNALRGILAEFIVASALEINREVRIEWDAYDLTFDDIKIEIKSAAYIQTWEQNDYSKITFNIAPTRTWSDEAKSRIDEIKRQSDIYIFCLLSHREQLTLNPLNIDQWEFYLLPTAYLDKYFPLQKTITLSSLLNLQPTKCNYNDLKSTMTKLIVS